MLGLRPTAISTLAKRCWLCSPFLSSRVTLTPALVSFSPATLVLSMMDANFLSSRRFSTDTRSRSQPGSRPWVISTTETLLPSAA